MSAPVTEAHLRLANQLVSSPPSPLVLATLIADSEAKACAEWRESDCLKGEAIDSLLLECDQLRAEVDALKQSIEAGPRVLREDAERNAARAERAEAELAAERARMDWLEDHGWITGEPCDRAAIDAAMKEDTK